MMTLARPPDRWEPETATPPVLQTLAAAVDPIVGSIVKADVRRLEPWIGFKNGCVVPERQVGSCAEHVRSLMESGMDKPIVYTTSLMTVMRQRVDVAVWEKSDGRCWYCGKQCKLPPADLMERMTIDHMTPWRSGGSHGIENLVPACFSCNSVKRNRDIEHHRWAIQRRKSGVPAFSDKQRAWLATFGVQFELCMGPCEPFWFEREGLS